MKRIQKFSIVGHMPGKSYVLPGMNEILAAAHSTNRAVYAAIKRDADERVINAVWLSQPRVKACQTCADVVIVHSVTHKRRDRDNIKGGAAKFIFDGLQKVKIIPNDGWEQINLVFDLFRVVAKGEKPRIDVYLLEGYTDKLMINVGAIESALKNQAQ
ncbi:MAG: hypothetical protein ACRCT6_04120 [Notoacmeibacter sp.]